MQTLVVLENPRDWDLHVPGVEVVAARSYLLEPRFSDERSARVVEKSAGRSLPASE